MEHVTLRAKRIYVDVIKERILKWGDYPTLAEQAQYNYLGFMRGKQETQSIVGVRMQARGWSDARIRKNSGSL